MQHTGTATPTPLSGRVGGASNATICGVLPTDGWTYDGLALGVKGALDQLVVGLARAAQAFVARKAWNHFGYARVDDHTRETLGRSGRWLRDLAVLGGAFERFPGLVAALTGDDGLPPVGQVAALAIARVATNESLGAWLALARRVPVRALKDQLCAAREAGSTSPLPTETETEVSGDGIRRSDDVARGTAGREPASGTREGDRPGDDGNICTTVVPAPLAVRVLFDDTRRLHDAVCGRDEPVASLVEALVAEANAGPVPVDADIRKPSGFSTAQYWRQVETDVYHGTDNWRRLRREPVPCERAVLRTLKTVSDVLDRAGRGGPEELQEQILVLVDLDDRLQRELGRLLLILGHGRAWSALDFTGLGHYAEQRLGLSRTTAQNRVAVARALLDRPLLAQAYAQGRVGLEAALLILRVLRRGVGAAGDAAERAWVAHASRVTLKRLRDEVRVVCGRRSLHDEVTPARPLSTREWHGSLRLAPGDFRTRLRELAAQATTEQASAAIRLHLSRPLFDDLLAATDSRRRLLEAAVRCEKGVGENTTLDAGGGPGGHPGEHVAGAPLEGRSISFHGSSDRTGARLFSTAGCLGLASARDHASGGEGAAGLWNDGSAALQTARELARRGGGRLPLWVGLLALLEDYIETWDDPRGVPRRAAQDIYIRDGWRCAAPGCTSRRHLENHHIVYRSQGGAVKDEANQICLCQFHHHQGEHGELATCQGVAPFGVVWRLGHPLAGTWFQNELRL